MATQLRYPHVSRLFREEYQLNELPPKHAVPCSSCGEDSYYALRRNSYPHSECENCYKKRTITLRSTRRAWIWEHKAAIGCIKCGEDDPKCLEFHHVQPSNKRFSIGSVSLKVPEDVIIKEMEKCIVLCANCHRNIDHS